MSRPQPSDRWIGIVDLQKYELLETLTSSTSKNQIDKIRITHPTQNGIYYQKYYLNSVIAKFEAIALALTGLPLTHLFVHEDKKTATCSLLTKDNQFHPIHSLFSESIKSEIDEALGASLGQTLPNPAPKSPSEILKNITDKHLKSLAKIFVDILILEDDDCHASNLGLTHDFSAFIRIDLDAIKYLVKNRYREARSIISDSSSPACFDINPRHIDTFIKPTDTCFPHYHPLKKSGFFTSEKNSYTEPMTLFFKKITEHPQFESILITQLLLCACQNIQKAENYCSHFELEITEKISFMHHYFERIESLKKACIGSTRVNTFLKNPLEQKNIKETLVNDPHELNNFNKLIATFLAAEEKTLSDSFFIVSHETDIMIEPILSEDNQKDLDESLVSTQLEPTEKVTKDSDDSFVIVSRSPSPSYLSKTTGGFFSPKKLPMTKPKSNSSFTTPGLLP